jgi:hypothetical protein
MLQNEDVLGKEIAYFPSNRARLVLPGLIVCVILGFVLNYTLAAIPGWGPFLTTLIMAGVAFGFGWRALHYWNREVVLYEQGFSYREGSRSVLFLYKEIASIRQQAEQLAYFGGLIRRKVFRYTLTTERGESMTLDNLYANIESLGKQVESRIYPLLETHIVEKLAQGERVPFAQNFEISRDGLHEQGRLLNWDSVGRYTVSKGMLTLTDQHGAAWHKLPLSAIYNLPLLIKLLKTRTIPIH